MSAAKPHRDIYAEITQKLIAAIEADPGQPVMPWRRPGGPLWMPVNALTEKPYNGINVVSLWVAAEVNGYSVPVWATYKQWLEKGAQVRKGEKSSLVVFCPLCRYRHKGHWSGAKLRLNRDFGKRFGDHAYAAEKLVGEIGSAFLASELQFTQDTRPDHAQYLAHWLDLMKEDSKAIFTAAAKAAEAVKYLKGLQPSGPVPDPPPRPGEAGEEPPGETPPRPACVAAQPRAQPIP